MDKAKITIFEKESNIISKNKFLNKRIDELRQFKQSRSNKVMKQKRDLNKLLRTQHINIRRS